MFRDAGLGEGFPDLTPKAQATKTRGFTRGKDGGAADTARLLAPPQQNRN